MQPSKGKLDYLETAADADVDLFGSTEHGANAGFMEFQHNIQMLRWQ